MTFTKTKYTISFWALILAIPNTKGQSDTNEYSKLIQSLLNNNPTDTIYYLEKVPGNWFDSTMVMNSLDTFPNPDINKKSQLKLTNQEKQIVIAELTKDVFWPLGMFPTSRRIHLDSTGIFLRTLNHSSVKRNPTENSETSKPRLNYVYAFKKPVFLRDNKLCITYHFALCGNSCGYIMLTLFQFNKGKWTKLAVLSNGEF